MIDLIVDYGLTLSILNYRKDKKFPDKMDYEDFKKEIDEYSREATFNKYGLNEFITKEKPLGYFMILWERVYRMFSTPYEAFSEINKYKIINYKYRDCNERLFIHYDLLRIYVDKLFGIELERMDDHAVDKLFRIMDSDDKVVLLKEGVAVFAWD